ncbi:hypothetical protein CSKR_100205 [Clonorchis sinensis]|uniref:Uncharacterized protein n=1 Tax=Clonorchis sinensis TaxID=79923 RepID=A0A3R7GDP5_CLOSI|nr:hypothetical protein CSKR_100205 [Clonorchis sinensis]
MKACLQRHEVALHSDQSSLYEPLYPEKRSSMLPVSSRTWKKVVCEGSYPCLPHIDQPVCGQIGVLCDGYVLRNQGWKKLLTSEIAGESGKNGTSETAGALVIVDSFLLPMENGQSTYRDSIVGSLRIWRDVKVRFCTFEKMVATRRRSAAALTSQFQVA